MSEGNKLNGTWTWAMIAAAFALGLGAGRYVAAAKSPSEPDTAASPPASAIVYKIPVSMSQAALGPEDALVTWVEWCDLPDPGCKNIEPALQALLAAHKQDARLVFRHYTSADNSRIHQFARVALETGNKFWEARALLLAHNGPVSDADLERMAGQLGMDWSATRRALDSGTYAGNVAADRLFARMFEVRGTPALFANGRPVQGALTPDALEKVFREEAARAKRLLASGVQRANLYTELTKNGTWTPPPRDLTAPAR